MNTEEGIGNREQGIANTPEVAAAFSVPCPLFPVPSVAAAVSMTGDEAAVWDLVRNRLGKEAVIDIDSLSLLTRLNARRVKAAVEGLIDAHGKKIGSYRGNPHGYSMIENAAELLQTCRALENQALKMWRRSARLQGRNHKEYLRELLGQMVLELDSEPRPALQSTELRTPGRATASGPVAEADGFTAEGAEVNNAAG